MFLCSCENCVVFSLNLKNIIIMGLSSIEEKSLNWERTENGGKSCFKLLKLHILAGFKGPVYAVMALLPQFAISSFELWSLIRSVSIWVSFFTIIMLRTETTGQLEWCIITSRDFLEPIQSYPDFSFRAWPEAWMLKFLHGPQICCWNPHTTDCASTKITEYWDHHWTSIETMVAWQHSMPIRVWYCFQGQLGLGVSSHHLLDHVFKYSSSKFIYL
jgi:hypothetical protein